MRLETESLENAAEKLSDATQEKQVVQSLSPPQAPTVVVQPATQVQPVDPILAAASGYETAPFPQQQPNMSNNVMYKSIMQQQGLSLQGLSEDTPMAEDELPELAPPAHLLLNPFDNKTRGKMWQSRMPPP